jgi:hypothetical protein
MLKRILLVATLFTLGSSLLHADPLPLGTWVQDSFLGAGSATAGSPFTFTSSTTTILTITDEFLAGDRFAVLEGATLIGDTSLVATNGDITCNGNPDACLADSRWSHGEFILGPGTHSLTVDAILSPFGDGGYALRLDPAQTPEPGSLVLMTGGLFGIGLLVKSRLAA